MAYAIIITNDTKLYLPLQEDNTIQAYHEEKEAKKQFSDFAEKFKSQNYETHVSGGLGLIYLNPQIIKLPEEPTELSKYVVSEKATILKGQGLGYFINMKCVEVKKDIEELVTFKISTEVIQNNASLSEDKDKEDLLGFMQH